MRLQCLRIPEDFHWNMWRHVACARRAVPPSQPLTKSDSQVTFDNVTTAWAQPIQPETHTLIQADRVICVLALAAFAQSLSQKDFAKGSC